MASHLTVTIKIGGVIKTSHSRAGANEISGFLAFGPDFALHILQAHQNAKRAASVTIEDGVATWRGAKGYWSIARLFEAGWDGGILLDWDDKVLWYFSDDFDGAAGAWLASWIDVFWPGWTIFRPQRNAIDGLLSIIGFTDRPDQGSTYAGDQWACRKLTAHDEVFFDRRISKNSQVLALYDGASIDFHPFYRHSDLATLIALGPESLPARRKSLWRKAPCLTFTQAMQADICGLVDLPGRNIWTSDVILTSCGARDIRFDNWPGWTITGDLQGYPAWLGYAGINVIPGVLFIAYAEAAALTVADGLRWTYSAKRRGKMFAVLRDANVTKGMPRSICTFAMVLQAMLARYMTTPELGTVLAKDRRYSRALWQPDMTAYHWLNVLNEK